jgi:outer membrane protein assembly factor BamB
MQRLTTLTVLLLFSGLATAGDWPQWLGPSRDGSTKEKVAPWKESPKVLWRHPAGEGNGGPVVAAGKVYLFAKVKDKEEEEVIALDAKTGKSIWRTAYPRGSIVTLFGAGPRSTPVVADGRIITVGITGLLTCFDAEKGEQAWQVDTGKEFAPAKLVFGASCSPLLVGRTVLINVGGKGASVVAFDTATGTVTWKSQDDPASYSSPIHTRQGTADELVFLTGKRLLGLNPADGGLFWEFPLEDKLFESSTTPQRMGDMLIASSITYGSVGLKLEVKDGKPAVQQAWKNSRLACYFSTPVAVGKDHMYMVTGANPVLEKPAATLRCVETATGKVLWSKTPVGEYHASLLRTGDDKLLFLDDAGNLMLLDPNTKEYKELARAKVCGKTWAHPAMADGRLYVRDEKELICLQLSE